MGCSAVRSTPHLRRTAPRKQTTRCSWSNLQIRRRPLAKGDKAAVPDIVVRREVAGGRQADASPTPPVDPPLHVVPLPAAKPGEVVRGATGAPIAVFVSRKTAKIYVRRQFVPLFDAPLVIAHPERPFGTHVFTAM